jgi:hypothetical protein
VQKPVRETVWQECRYKVCKPVCEEFEREEKYIVYCPVQETHYREVREVVQKPVWEEQLVACKYTVCKPVYETHYRDVIETHYQTVVETHYRDCLRTVQQPVTVKQPVCRVVCEPRVEQYTVPGPCYTKAIHEPGQCYVDPHTGHTCYKHPVTRFVTCQAPPQVCYRTVMVPRTVIDYVPVTYYVQQCYVEKVPYQVCKVVPIQTVKKVPYTVCKMVAEEQVRYVPVRRCRMVCEERVRHVPYTICKMVPQERTRIVNASAPEWLRKNACGKSRSKYAAWSRKNV